MNLVVAFNDFCTQLSARTGFLSEDNIRFYWFTAMLNQDNDLNHYSLEEPYYPALVGNKELDLMYEDKSEILAIEIKFHRYSKKNAFPLPDSAGTLFNDVFRITSWTPSTSTTKPIRYFVLYITDDRMHHYLNDKSNAYRVELEKFYNLPVGAPAINCSFKCDVCGGDTPKTFFRNACKSWIKNHCAKFTSKNNVCNKCPKGIAPIVTRQIQAIGNNNIKCFSASLYPGGTTSKDCHIRLYEVI